MKNIVRKINNSKSITFFKVNLFYCGIYGKHLKYQFHKAKEKALKRFTDLNICYSDSARSYVILCFTYPYYCSQ